MSRIFLVRHGETELNHAGRLQGHTDADLSALGYRQAEMLGDYLAAESIDTIYSSDLRRAAKTAEIIARQQQKPVITCPELREINYGKLEGLTFGEVERLYPSVAKLFLDKTARLEFPGGESADQFGQRVRRFLDRLKPQPEQTILIVAHGGPLRFLICSLLGIDPQHWRQIQLDLASVSVINTCPEIAVISRLNDISHLK